MSRYGPWVGLLAILTWTRWPEPWILAGASVAVVLAVGSMAGIRSGPGRRSLRPAGAAGASALLLAATVLGFVAQRGLDRIESDWPSFWAERETNAIGVLGRVLDRRVEAGRSLVDALAGEPYADTDQPGTLRLLRERYDMDAVAIYDDRGELRVWDGVHRGAVPEDVRLGTTPFAFEDRPLFSYLYVTRSTPSTGGTAVAALLLDASLPPGIRGSEGSLVAELEDRTGVDLTVARPDRVEGSAIWDFRYEEEDLFAVSAAQPLQADARDDLLTYWQRWVALALGGAWALLAFGGMAAPGRWFLSVGSLVAAALLLPLGRLLGAEAMASPTSFLLAPPLDVTLLRTLAVIGAGLTALAGLHLDRSGAGKVPRLRPTTGLPARIPGLLVVGLGFPVTVGVVTAAPSTEFWVSSEWAFLLVQLLLALTLSALALVGLEMLSVRRNGVQDRHGPPGGVDGRGARTVAAAMVLAIVLGGLLTAWIGYAGGAPSILSLLWILPTLVAARADRGSASEASRRDGAAPSAWMIAGVLAVTCAVPYAWGARLEARIEMGETRLARLGATADPFTEFLLQRFSDSVESLDAAGAEPVEILYRAWAESGMAEEGVPAWITRWSSGDIPREELRIGLSPPRPTAADEFLAEARLSASTVVRRLRRPDARYVVVVPLRSGAAVSAVVPPASVAPSPVGTGPLTGPGAEAQRDGLAVVPLLPDDPRTAPDSTRWVRTGEGWRGERTLELLDGPYHVHYTVDLASPGLLVARGSLLFALDLGIFSLLFAGGLLLVPGMALPVRRILGWLGTFQGRVTLALFAFFLLSVALLGSVGYQTLTGASSRTAQALADRAVDDAVGGYLEVQGSMDLLAQRVGADLLRYRNGRLVGGSTAEMVELGLHEGWIPFDVHESMADREALTGTASGGVGSWEYVVSYRRMPDGSVLGAPVPLEAGDVALRRREMMDLLAFALLLGGVLSLGLAVLVGRTLVQPLQELSRATGRVGLGDLSARLPDSRSDEFGTVFEDFNQMVERLREARRDLVRTERILAWGEMARQVAHEVKNPLTPIKLSVQHIRRAWEDQHADFPVILSRNVEATLREIDRLDAIARSFSRFGAPGSSADEPLEPTDVGAVVADTLDLYASHEGPIRFVGTIPGGLPHVRAKPDELKEVLVNLLENARASMTGSGADGGTVRVEAEPLESDQVEIRVSDDGPGISEELLPRIFEPRFSTRSAGTGLGLAIVRRLVESWGGRVHARSVAGEGTTIVMVLRAATPTGGSGSGDAGGVSTP